MSEQSQAPASRQTQSRSFGAASLLKSAPHMPLSLLTSMRKERTSPRTLAAAARRGRARGLRRFPGQAAPGPAPAAGSAVRGESRPPESGPWGRREQRPAAQGGEGAARRLRARQQRLGGRRGTGSLGTGTGTGRRFGRQQPPAAVPARAQGDTSGLCPEGSLPRREETAKMRKGEQPRLGASETQRTERVWGGDDMMGQRKGRADRTEVLTYPGSAPTAAPVTRLVARHLLAGTITFPTQLLSSKFCIDIPK